MEGMVTKRETSTVIKKGWGHELIWESNEKYCGKMLVFYKVGNQFSMHFHKNKDETWYVHKGKFLLNWIDTDTASTNTVHLKEGDTWRNMPLVPHQLKALEENSIIIEISTEDYPHDNYRVAPGDSQLEERLKDKPDIKSRTKKEHNKDIVPKLKESEQ